MAAELLTRGMVMAPTPEAADVVLVNTCAFIDAARRESMAAIREVCALKTQGPCRAVIVCGCLPQRYRDTLPDQLPEVDAFLGIDELDRIADTVDRVYAGDRLPRLRAGARPQRLFDSRLPAVRFSGAASAYLKVAEGCNHRCAFCAIPGIRGRYRSRAIADIRREAEQLLASGAGEINLISQDTTAYGCDRRDGASLPRLLRELGRIGGRFWIRWLYGFPSRVTDELLDTMGTIEQVVHYLDVPIQHSHPAILRAMGRGHTFAAVQALPARARGRLPDITLRTTCLVGFPGETRTHFEHLRQHLAAARYDHVGVFTYSPEEGTPALTLAGRPGHATAERRRDRLLEQQQQIVAETGAALAGRPTAVLLEAPANASGTRWTGRSPRYAPEVDGSVRLSRVPPAARPGQILPARYTAHAGYDARAVCL